MTLHSQRGLRALVLPAAVAATAALAGSPPPAAAQTVCRPYAMIAGYLDSAYGERPVWRWVHSDGQIGGELWVNAETGTLTILGFRPDGVACALASGTGAEPVAAPAADPGEGS